MAELGERYRLSDRIMIYDADSGRWSTGGRMPLGVAAPAVVDLGRGWLLAGGEYSPGLRTPAVHHAQAITATAEAPVGTTHVYKRIGSRELKVHVVSPPDTKPTDRRPALVFFHGGGWTGGTPAQFNKQAAYLASRGLVCVQVEYRLLDKNDQAPPIVCVQDAKSAMRWVRAHAAELGIDPARIGAGGGSAGGHLAAFVGMVAGGDDPDDDLKISPRAAALVLFNPVIDNGPDGGWGQARVGARVKEFSPAHNISGDDPPAIIFLGRDDKLIPVATIERFRAGMKSAGIRCDASFYPGQGHGFFNKDPYRTWTLIEADKFLASLGWLEGAPTLDESESASTPAPAAAR
jgi:acetyl esterase/lipase